MNAQDLKDSILQLAIQGKLVEQREEEGTAEELLQQIKSEKDKLIKEKKIKIEKPLPDITDEEIPFNIPDRWEWVRLGNIFNVTMGQSPSGKSVINCDGGSGIEFHQGKVFFGDEYIQKSNQLTNKPTKIVERNTVLLCVRAPVGNVNITERKICIGRGLCGINTLAGMSERFLLIVLRAYKSDFIKKATGTTFVAITAKVVRNQLIPLPPLEEQKRIVAKIEELMPFVEQYDEAHSKVEELNKKFPEDMQKSILQYAIHGKLVEQREEEGTAEELYQQIQHEKAKQIKIGKIKKQESIPEITEEEISFEIPNSWKWVTIGQVCSNIRYGTSKKSYKKGKIAVLRMGNLQGGRIDYSKLVYSSDDEDIQKYKLEKNDLLFNRTNSRELVGKTAIYKSELPAIYAGYLVRFTPVLVSSDYINYVMQSDYYWRYCQSVRSDAIGQSNINAEKLKGFVFPLPPLDEQQRIVNKIKELQPYCQQLIKKQ